MILGLPWRRLDFVTLVSFCRNALGTHGPQESRGRVVAQDRGESLVQDVLRGDDALVGFWRYDQTETEHVRSVTLRLHGVVSGDGHSGALVSLNAPAWTHL